jgi:hypothetical protein
MSEYVHKAYDPGEPFDAMAETFKRQIADMALDAMKATIYRELSPQRQLECFVVGTLTGIVGVCFASIDPKGWPAILDYLTDSVKFAGEQAKGIIENAERSQ